MYLSKCVHITFYELDKRSEEKEEQEGKNVHTGGEHISQYNSTPHKAIKYRIYENMKKKKKAQKHK